MHAGKTAGWAGATPELTAFSRPKFFGVAMRTTMNIYTQAVPTALREANSKVVRLVLPAQVA
jgi:hypothetical protein